MTKKQLELEFNDENGAPLVPYLPPLPSNKQYTLVLDLDETLIHYDVDEIKNEGFYLIRPGAL